MGNALLVRIDGRDAVLTNLHPVLDDETGKPHNGCTYDDLTSNAWFLYNASYFDGTKREQIEGVSKRVRVSGEISQNLWKWAGEFDDPWNLDKKNEYDWLIFELESNVSNLKAPDGTTRGYLAKDQTKPGDYEDGYTGYIIGFDPKFAEMTGSNASSYQECAFFNWDEKVMHTCDTTVGASSSLLGVYVDGEIRLRGIHNRRAITGDGPMPRAKGTTSAAIYGVYIATRMNSGLLAETIEEAGGFSFDGPSEAGSQPDVPTDRLAYHIQRAFQEAGCYSGQLDNVWGPASRRALANFAELTGSAVPGEEPSPALLRVVENAPPSAKCN